MNKIVEVCCGSYQDGINAYLGGAKRIELNSDLAIGGLTPSLASVLKLKEETDLKIISMVRPRGGGFNYSDDDFKIMMLDGQMLLENKSDGLAFGFLNSDGTINELMTEKMVSLIHNYHKEAVFHRAFDVCVNPYKTIEKLIELKVDRVLTSGQKAKAIDGLDLIKDLQSKYGEKIEILVGSGVDDTNAKYIMDYTNVNQVHSSCKGYLIDNTTSLNEVTYSYLKGPYSDYFQIVDKNVVTKLIGSVE